VFLVKEDERIFVESFGEENMEVFHDALKQILLYFADVIFVLISLKFIITRE
jgi:hypothetical protein